MRVVQIEAQLEVSLRRVCRLSGARPGWIAELVEHGVLEARGPTPTRWRFDQQALSRLLRARRMQQDLGLNPAGIALALELTDEVRMLRRRVRALAAAPEALRESRPQ